MSYPIVIDTPYPVYEAYLEVIETGISKLAILPSICLRISEINLGGFRAVSQRS
jgi:hypothetical protein